MNVQRIKRRIVSRLTAAHHSTFDTGAESDSDLSPNRNDNRNARSSGDKWPWRANPLHCSPVSGRIFPSRMSARRRRSSDTTASSSPAGGDHFEVDKALKDKNYCKGRWEILRDNGLKAFAISNHLVGQAVCDLIDERHKVILAPDVWGDGNRKVFVSAPRRR